MAALSLSKKRQASQAFFEDVVVAVEDGICEFVFAQILPNVFGAVELGRVAWQADELDIGGDPQVSRSDMPHAP